MIGSLTSDVDENQDTWGGVELLRINAHGFEIIGPHDRACREYETLVAVLTNLANIV
jgi:hypothetical protein